MAKKKEDKKRFMHILPVNEDTLKKFNDQEKSIDEDAHVLSMQITDTAQQPPKAVISKIKFYPPPQGCDTCWKKRFAEYRKILDSFQLKSDDELQVQIIGMCSKADIVKLDSFLNQYLKTFYSDSVRIIYFDHTGELKP